MTTETPAGIKYPTRAENLNETKFPGYEIVTSHWKRLIGELADKFRTLDSNDAVTMLGLYGPQGVGKSTFQARLLKDHETAKSALAVNPDRRIDAANIWQQIVKGDNTSIDPSLLVRLTNSTTIQEVPKDKRNTWLGWATSFSTADRGAIILFDNAERGDLFEGLGIEVKSTKERTDALPLAAEKLVEAARTTLSRTLIIFFSNDNNFLTAFSEAMDRQHDGMMTTSILPIPNELEKEQAVRINTNRFNHFSYWGCLDHANDDARQEVQSRLRDHAMMFPKVWEKVDETLKPSGRRRGGRPRRRNLLTLVLFAGVEEVSKEVEGQFVPGESDVEAEGSWYLSQYYKKGGWASTIGDRRRASLIESEWHLRLVVLGRPFVRVLRRTQADAPLNHEGQVRKDFLEILQLPLGPTFGEGRESPGTYRDGLSGLASSWPDPSESDEDFWSQNQSRSYEPALKILFPRYDKSTPVWHGKRPDLIVSDYVPCSLLSGTFEELSRANCFEFTAQKAPTPASVSNYLGSKLPNYARVMEERSD